MQKSKKLWYDYSELSQTKKLYNEEIDIDVSKINSVLAGPKRPQDKVLLTDVHKKSLELLKNNNDSSKAIKTQENLKTVILF